MKKLIAILVFVLTGAAVSFAQTATQTTYTPVTPTVNAVQMSGTDAKCTTKSCCSSTSKAAALTSTNTSESTTAEAAQTEEEKSDKKCQTVSFGMSAVKPTANLTKEEKKIED